MTYIFYLLVPNPKFQDELYEEAQRVYGDKDPQYEDISELVYSTCIIYETMRLFPFGSTISQISYKDKKIQGKYPVPEGTAIAFDMVNTPRNEKYWGPNADEFDPLRFLDPNSDSPKFKSPDRGTWIAFGDGPRACLGYNIPLSSRI